MKEKSKFEEEISFKKVAQNPIRWFGLIYPYFIIILVACGIFYVNNMERAFRNSVQATMNDTLKRTLQIQKVKGSVSEGVDVETIKNPSQEILSKGQQLYNTMCSLCHGENGNGNGPAGTGLNPPPRNFHAETGWVNEKSFTGMYKTLQEGIPNSAMTAYEYLPAEDKVAIIHHIKSFADFPEVNDAEIQKLEGTYNITQGQTTPSQIPIDEAITRISEESIPTSQKIYAMISYINNHPDEEGVRIFQRITKDKVKVLSSVNQTDFSQGNFDDFVKSILRDAGKRGFNSNVVNLTNDEWNELYRFLNMLSSTNNT